MCGFVGWLNLNDKSTIDERLFLKMNDEISHRGPDGEGFAFLGDFNTEEVSTIKTERSDAHIIADNSKRNVALAHRRLSIIDLSTDAAQPMQSADGKITLLFNGEIYNHQVIRDELVAKGYEFKTSHSDTETIIYAYREWGIDCVKRFRGMYAISIWDEEKDTMWLVRDKVGIKPLYYTIQPKGIYFASEIKAILEDTSIAREVNVEGMYNYLSFLTVPAPQTMFKNIFKLPAGHRLKIEKGKVGEIEAYWDVFDDVSLNQKSKEEICDEVLENLKESVDYRGVSDLQVGVFLSGGIDSSLNAKLFSDIANYPVKSFSVGYQDDESLSSYTNEFKYAKQAAEHANCEYYQQELTQQDFIDFLPKLIYHQDEPIGDPVCMPLFYVSKLAKENGITVCQVGEGSDELFWGYSSWKYMLKLQELNDIKLIPSWLKKLGLAGMKMIGKDKEMYYEWLKRGANNERVFWGGAEAFTETQKKGLLTEKVYDNLSANYSSANVINKYYEQFKSRTVEQSNLNWMSYLDLKLRLPELLLARVDKMSMAVSLEARVPFLDDKFVSHAMGIKSQLKTTSKESKYILKEAIKGILPENIIYRKKQGFDAPVYDWMMQELGDVAKEKIKLFNQHTQFLNQMYIDDLFSRKKGKQIWFVLNLALWWEHYIYNNGK